MLFEQMVNGVALGSIYALLALGFTLVYGILFFVNFPHGDILMFGSFVSLMAIVHLGWSFVPTILVAMVATGLVAIIVEKVAYSRLRGERRLAPLLSALGVSLVVSNSALLIFGPRTKSFPNLLIFKGLNLPGNIQPIVILILLISLVLMVLLQLFLKKSVTGIAINAASQSLATAQLMGINPSYVISVTFFASGVLAGAGGFLLCMRYGAISPTIGIPLMLKAFAACVLGGIGNVRGAVVGGMLLGIAEVLTIAYIAPGYRDAGAFLLLILVLLIRPWGLLGGRTEVWA